MRIRYRFKQEASIFWVRKEYATVIKWSEVCSDLNSAAILILELTNILQVSLNCVVIIIYIPS